MENATLVDIVKEQNPNGGLPSEVWNRFVKENGSTVGRKVIAHDAMIYNALVKWYGSGRSLYDLRDDDAAKYVAFLSKNTSANSVWRVSLPTLTEIWAKSLPLCENPWSKFKWDSMRESVVPEKPLPMQFNAQTSLEDFAEKYFAAEASSGKKIERNALGMVRHLMKHMGVKTIGDVTRKVAYDYAIKIHDDPKCTVVRGGADRINKLSAMWKTLIPDSENPFDGVTYADAMRLAKYNAMLETKTDLSPTECLRALPPTLWNQYALKHSKVSVHRMSTVKSIFFRFWEKTGLETPMQVTDEIASKYLEETLAEKATGMDDMRELRAVWDLLMPNIVNPWENAMKPFRKKGGPRPKDAESVVEKVETVETPVATDEDKTETVEVEKAETTTPLEVEPQNVYTFEELFANWKNSLKREYDPKTYEQYQRILSYFMDYCKVRGVSTIGKDTVTVEMAEDFLNLMAKRIQIIRNIISPLKTIWTVNFGLNNPWRTISSGMQTSEGNDESIAEPSKTGFWKRLLRFFGIGR